jgi:Transposase IS66 family
VVVAAPAPDHAIARGRAGAGLLAHIVVSKYDDHLPLYRQAEIFARDGVSLETSTLCGWVGATAATLQPLVDALAVEVLASDNLHVDDTPVPVLAPGTGKTKTGRLWTYVRDERPFGGSRKPAALFFYSPDRKGEHPQAHLKQFRGVIHADGYAGFNQLFAGGRIVEAGCWAHVRRKNSLTSTLPPAHPSPKKHSIALPSSMPSRRSSKDHRPSGDGSSASSNQSRLPRHWPLGPRAPCASSRANPSSPRPSAICGRAGPRWCAVSTTAGWRSTTIPPNALCVVSPLAARIICLPAPMPAAAAPLRSTR